MTTTYNVYRVKFSQISGPKHVGIALVPAQFEDQVRGRFYHVKGDVGMGMDYEVRPRYNFASTQSYDSKEFVFQLPVEKLQDFEAISSAQTPPHDSRVLTTRDVSSLDPPVRDCVTWVEEVLAAAQKL